MVLYKLLVSIQILLMRHNFYLPGLITVHSTQIYTKMYLQHQKRSYYFFNLFPQSVVADVGGKVSSFHFDFSLPVFIVLGLFLSRRVTPHSRPPLRNCPIRSSVFPSSSGQLRIFFLFKFVTCSPHQNYLALILYGPVPFLPVTA